MSIKEKNTTKSEEEKTADEKKFEQLIEKDATKIPQVYETVKGTVISASKSEIKLDIDGILMGVVRGPELYEEAEEYANLKPGDEIEATVIEEENENGELELSFRYAGQEKARLSLIDAFENRKNVKVKIVDANKGGLLSRFCQIPGFLPVSQLSPENYPRINGGDKSKILEKLKSFIGREMEVKVIAMEEKEDKIIFSEKDVWSEKQKNVIDKYKVGTVVEGIITAITDFGVFINFGDNMEGLIHISELAWQRIDNPVNLFKIGDKINGEIINIDGFKVFLSAKKLLKDPWKDAEEKYKAGQKVKGTILKVNPFGLFVKLDEDIHGLAHITQLNLEYGQKINDLFKRDDEVEFEVVSIEPKEHRLGLKLANSKKEKKEKVKEENKEEKKEEKDEKKEDKDEKKEEKKKEKEEKVKKTEKKEKKEKKDK